MGRYIFSVVVTVFNKGNVLDKCAMHLINQTFSNIQIIFVDDESQDSSLEICKKYADLDERVLVIRQENQGVAVARNTGLLAAEGDYIVFVDADDYLSINVLEEAMKLFAADPKLDMITWGCIEEDKNGNVLANIPMKQQVYATKKDAYIQINERLLGYVWLWAFRRKMLIQNAIKFEQWLVPIDDYHFVLQAFFNAGSIGSIANAFYHYVRSNSLSSLSKTIPSHVFEQHKMIMRYKLEFFRSLKMEEVFISREMKISAYAALKNAIKHLFRDNDPDKASRLYAVLADPMIREFFYENPAYVEVKASEKQRYAAVTAKDEAAILHLFEAYESEKTKGEN